MEEIPPPSSFVLRRNVALNLDDETIRIFSNDLSGAESEVLLCHVKQLCYELGIIKEG